MKFLLYLECLIFFTFWLLLQFVLRKLQYIGQSSDWYADRGLHAWQAKKALKQYTKEYNEKLEKVLRK